MSPRDDHRHGIHGATCPVCASLADMSPDDREAVIALAREIRETPPSYEGLRLAECKLLRALVARRGKPVEHAALTGVIAPDPSNPPFDTAVKVAVYGIRRKRPDLGRHIRTVWGVGYAWDGPAP